jgi:hypothetical protein
LVQRADWRAGTMTELESEIVMPHKFNATRRHHIPQMKFKVRNWSE